MKNIVTLFAIILISNSVMSQTDTITFYGKLLKDIKIGQSMETSDQRGEPAQFQLTIPQKNASSYLVNLGALIGLNFLSSNNLISKLTTEYHLNTLIDKKQNNFELGYQGTWDFLDSKDKNTNYFIVFDPKYVYDGVEIKNSFATNILFSWLKIKSNLNWNANTFFNKNREALFTSLFFGAQLQDIIKAKADTTKGVIVRPLYTPAIYFTFFNAKLDPIVKFSLTYTGRYDLVNNTRVSEGYTQLLKAGIDWYLVNKPFKISLGLSYNYGSDPIQGLLFQNFWLVSINISK